MRLHASSLPREKLLAEGVAALTTRQLIEVILGTGSKDTPVHMLAKKVATILSEKKSLNLTDFTSVKGLGVAKSCQILAAIELVERIRPSGYPLIDSLEKVLSQLGELRYASREHILCLYLNTRLQLLLKETISIGSLNQSIISPRDIFSPIKYHPVHYIILSHNHPSGNAAPSKEDILFTNTIQSAGQLLGVEVLDHVIIAEKEHFSFKEQGLLKEEGAT